MRGFISAASSLFLRVFRMIELSSVMWLAVMLSGLLGFLRGWRAEVRVLFIPIAYIYVLLQLDAIIRAFTLLVGVSSYVWFILHSVGFFVTVWYFGYRGRQLIDTEGERYYVRLNSSSSWLGALFGGINGWLMMGTFWYLMDVHGYPLAPYITAPGLNSPSVQALWALPPVIFTGGISAGNPDFLLIAALFVLAMRLRSD